MRSDIIGNIYNNEMYLTYLRYHPKWYVILNNNPLAYQDFVKEVKKNLKITTADQISKLEKQISFISGMIKYLNT